MSDRHRLLKRQLRKCFGDGPLPEGTEALLEMVDQSYKESERHRLLLERSLELTSDELLERNAQLEEDLRARVEAEAAVRESEAQLRATLAGLPDSIYVVEPSGGLVAAHVTDIALPKVQIGENLFEAVPDDRKEAVLLETTEAFATNQVVEDDFERNDRRFNVRFVPYHQRYVAIILRDVTEQEALKQQVIMTERMASIGTLAAGVAHEINNPLTYVLTNLSFAREELELTTTDEELINALREAESGAERVSKIVSDLRAISRGNGETSVMPTDARRALEAAISIAGVEIQRRGRLEVHLDDLPPVQADESQLAQVLLNLLVNAAQAMPTTSRHHVIEVRSEVTHDEVALIVADDGPGIPKAVASKLFEPFFTTKGLGEGTGLGLSISRRLVQRFGGRLDYVPTPVGACFRIVLRRAPASAVPSVTVTDPEYASGVHATISARVLIIDDEVDLGRAVKRMLKGHEVALAYNGRRGLELLLEEDFDLVLCDLHMPDMTGFELHEQLAVRRPDHLERLIFMTGGTMAEPALSFVDETHVQCIEKPFPPADLRRYVTKALRARRRRDLRVVG